MLHTASEQMQAERRVSCPVLLRLGDMPEGIS